MARTFTRGTVNGHLMGIAMKELVRRAIGTAQANLGAFEVREKAGYDSDGEPDLFTTVDTAAQEVYVKSLRECFPRIGIIGEEGGLRVPFVGRGVPLHFTVDPIDGTKALTRRQSHGIGTMIALIRGIGKDAEVISAFVGDVMTREIFGFRPDSRRVHRISKFEIGRELEIDVVRPLSDQRLLIFDRPDLFSPSMRALIPKGRGRTPFKDLGMSDGSIGLIFARLWKAEVGAIALLPSHQTPWDTAPVLGISKRMGFRFLAFDRGGRLRDATELSAPPLETTYTDCDLIVVHESRVMELRAFIGR